MKRGKTKEKKARKPQSQKGKKGVSEAKEEKEKKGKDPKNHVFQILKRNTTGLLFKATLLILYSRVTDGRPGKRSLPAFDSLS